MGRRREDEENEFPGSSEEDDGEGFDETEAVDLSEGTISSRAFVFGPDEEDDDDDEEGFDEGEYIEKGDEPDETRDGGS